MQHGFELPLVFLRLLSDAGPSPAPAQRPVPHYQSISSRSRLIESAGSNAHSITQRPRFRCDFHVTFM
jgi:hypothetical protein